MKHRNLILTTILAGSLTAAGFAGISQAGMFGGDHHRGHAEQAGYGKHDRDPVRRLMKQVDLTDAQQVEIKSIIEASRAGTDDARKQLRDNREAMHELIGSDAYSIDRVRALANQQAQLEADLTVTRIDTMHRVHQVLTPEQQAELKTLRDKRMEKREARRDEREDGSD